MLSSNETGFSAIMGLVEMRLCPNHCILPLHVDELKSEKIQLFQYDISMYTLNNLMNNVKLPA